MKFFVSNRRLSLLSLAAAATLFSANVATPAHAALSWYDGFAINDADPGSPTTYVSGALGGQDGGTGTFFTGSWVATGDDNVLAAGSLTRGGAPSLLSTGDKSSDQPAVGCCNTARTGRNFATPLQNVDGTIYMGFLVNFGSGNPADPHYRAVEFWDGAPGDGNLNMSLGVSSFGNYNDPINDADGPQPTPDTDPPNVTNNRQISARVDGVREEFGVSVQRNYQLEEHLEWNDPLQFEETHSVVIKFDLSTSEIGLGGTGDTISFFLDPTPSDVVEPTPSLVVSGVDLLLNSMSSIVLFNFTGAMPGSPGAFDELRVGSTWGDVANLGLPEPASFSLVGIGAIGMLMSARRKRS